MYPNQNPNNQENIVGYPPANNPNQYYEQPNLATSGISKNNTLSITVIIILAVLAVGGIAFGAITYINNATEITKLNETISEQEYTIKNNTTLTTTDNSNPSNYIYIGEWGIKIKIPEELSWVGYSFAPSDNTSSVFVYGVKGHFDTRPQFLNELQLSGGLASITRAPIGYGSVDGLRVLSSNGYDYYYTILQKAVTENAENAEQADLELSSKALIETMLTTADNYSLIQ